MRAEMTPHAGKMSVELWQVLDPTDSKSFVRRVVVMESMSVSLHWRTSLNVGALVTLVAAVHYFYMREFWITIGTSPILYRYDWLLSMCHSSHFARRRERMKLRTNLV